MNKADGLSILRRVHKKMFMIENSKAPVIRIGDLINILKSLIVEDVDGSETVLEGLD